MVVPEVADWLQSDHVTAGVSGLVSQDHVTSQFIGQYLAMWFMDLLIGQFMCLISDWLNSCRRSSEVPLLPKRKETLSDHSKLLI